jgi:hypothetical protein
MHPAPSSRGGTFVIAGLCLGLAAFLYPVAVVPLRSKEVREVGAEPGFSKKSAWKELERKK